MKRSDDRITELYGREFVRPKLQPKDFYWEDGNLVLTKEYHLRRGSCCNSNCRHCPYKDNVVGKQTDR